MTSKLKPKPKPKSDALATPCLLIEGAIVSRNINRLADYAHTHHLQVRPHTKTHKSLVLAAEQLAAGARGLAVAKAGEAEVMAEASDDILLAYPAVDAPRCQKVAALARSHTVRVAVDSDYAIQALAEAAQRAETTVGLLIELDVGLHRVGVQMPVEATRLAQRVSQLASLRLDGLFFYPGHIWGNASEQAKPLADVAALVDETLGLWSRSGLSASIVSGGSTPTAYQSHLIQSQNELRPGTYVFNDMNTVRGGHCELADCAASILCTVVSDSVPGKVVIDAGTKALTSDRNVPKPDSGHGHVVEYPQAVITRLSEEHGELDIRGCDRAPKIGERVRVIPNHICPCVNLQEIAWFQSAAGELRQLKIDARGLLS